MSATELSNDFKKGIEPLLSSETAVVVAYSGGLDSHVLLHLCAVEKVAAVRAVHIHHGLNEEADYWASCCEKTCQQLSVPFSLIHVDAEPQKGESREEAARNARYNALRAQLNNDELLLTAQHQEDQAETLLLQLFRGCGVKGLAAMPVSTKFGRGRLVRPLLNCSQQALQDYAARHNLQWIEDSSNQDESYDRNYLRHSIMPLLEHRWPAVSRRIARTSSHCGEASHQLDEVADRFLSELVAENKGPLLVDRVLALGEAEQRLTLRRWIESQNGRAPSEKLLRQIITTVLTASVDAMPSVSWANYSVKRYRNGLYFIQEQTGLFDKGPLIWSAGKSKIKIPGSGELIYRVTPRLGISAKLWHKGSVLISFRRGGERLKPVGRAGTRQLKKLFQEVGIPPWERARIPLIYIDERLAAVSGLWIADWCKGEGLGEDISLSFIKDFV